MHYIFRYDSVMGKMMMASDGEALVGLWFEGQKHFASTLEPLYKEEKLPVFEQTCKWLMIYFSGIQPDFTPVIRLKGTAFQQIVWQLLLDVPYGKTVTYKKLAEQITSLTGKTISFQAVGGAVGRNPISIIVPCHRVVGTDGSLTGYAGGLSKKAALLALERVGVKGRAF